MNNFQEDHFLWKPNPGTLERENQEVGLSFGSQIRIFAVFFQNNTVLGSIIDKILKRISDYINRTQDQAPLTREDDYYLKQSLAHLYVYNGEYKTAIDLYLLLNDSAVFNVIRKSGRFEYVSRRHTPKLKLILCLGF